MSQGIIYIATGDKYLEEAMHSAASVKEVMPTIPIALFTDKKIEENDLFEDVICIEDPTFSYLDKIEWVRHSPFDETIFLDTDTFVCADLSDVFQLLEKDDLLICHDTWRSSLDIEGIPAAFPELNTGVIAFRKTDSTDTLFKEWKKAFEKYDKPTDQPAFRYALFNSSIRFGILPNEYNFRTWGGNAVGGNSFVMVLHGRANSPKQLGEQINANSKKFRGLFTHI